MESPDSVIASEDSVAKGVEKVVLSEGNKPKSHLMENGWHGYEFMRNGSPRPSAVREYPEGIVPLYCRPRYPTAESMASEKEKQTHTLPNTSEDKLEHHQDEESMVVATEGEGINGKEIRPALKNAAEKKPEKASNLTLKKMKAGQGENKNIENGPSKSNKLGDRKIISGESKALKQESDAKQTKAKTSFVESASKKLLKAGKSTEVKGSAVVVSQELTEVGSDKKEVTLIIKTQKTVTTTSSVVVVTEQETEQPESQRKTDASEIELQQREQTLEKDAGQVGKEKLTDPNTEALPIKRKPGSQDSPQCLTGQSDQGNSSERDATLAPLAVQAMRTSELSPVERDSEGTDLDKQEKTAERKEKQDEENTKLQPVKRKSGTRDVPNSISPQPKKKVLKEGGHERPNQDVEIKISQSKVSGTVKEKDKGENMKVVGKTGTDNGKSNVVEKKKRPLEGPDSAEKSKKLPKIKPSKDEQSPAKANEKQLDSETQGQEMGTPKRATKKPSAHSEPPKKARRSGGKPPRSVTSIGDVSNARNLIVDSLRLYDSVRRKFLQDEEKNGKQGRGSRADLQAVTFLKDQNTVRGPEKAHGALPGVFVGDIYLLRTELSFIRVHGPIQGGIEYLTTKDSEFNSPVAISIISNVGQDGEDDGEELVYTGQGGRSADNKQIADQKLERGNLAMDGSRKFNVPVRVIRGIKDVNSPTGKIYIYDGLYDVQETYTAKGSGGFDEFKFRLQRRTDQLELGSKGLKLAADLKSQSPSSRKDIVISDISKGKESRAISVENAIDEDKGPAEFEYVTKLVYSKDMVKQEATVGCKCNGGCSPSETCSCFTQNGDEFLYLNGGHLVREKDFVYECGRSCACSSSCRNRTPGTGLKFRLDIFKTADRGWGVRSLELITAGSFVCEYVGRVVADQESATEGNDQKYKLYTNWLPERSPRWGDISNFFPETPSSSLRPDAEKPNVIIDASNVGNVARFINHSCSPNLLVQKVLSDYQDVRYPQFKLFAMENIPPLKELTFDYGYPPPDQESVRERLVCLCGSPDCRGKLYV